MTVDTNTTATPVLNPTCGLADCNDCGYTCQSCNERFETRDDHTTCDTLTKEQIKKSLGGVFSEATADELRAALIVMTERMALAAVEQNWCSEYEDRIEEMAARLPMHMVTEFRSLAERVRRVRVVQEYVLSIRYTQGETLLVRKGVEDIPNSGAPLADWESAAREIDGKEVFDERRKQIEALWTQFLAEKGEELSRTLRSGVEGFYPYSYDTTAHVEQTVTEWWNE